MLYKTKINIPIYNNYVLFYVIDNMDFKHWVKKNKKVFVREEDTGHQAAFWELTNGELALQIPPDVFKEKDCIQVLAHEILHATFCVLRRANIRPSRDSEEAYTYLHDFIFGKVIDIIRDMQKKKIIKNIIK